MNIPDVLTTIAAFRQPKPLPVFLQEPVTHGIIHVLSMVCPENFNPNTSTGISIAAKYVHQYEPVPPNTVRTEVN